MGGEVLVSLLVTGVLGDVVEVLSSDDDGSVHLGGNDGTGEDTATDGDETGEGALLVCRAKLGQHLVLHRNIVPAMGVVSSSSRLPLLSTLKPFVSHKTLPSSYSPSRISKFLSHVPM